MKIVCLYFIWITWCVVFPKDAIWVTKSESILIILLFYWCLLRIVITKSFNITFCLRMPLKWPMTWDLEIFTETASVVFLARIYRLVLLFLLFFQNLQLFVRLSFQIVLFLIHFVNKLGFFSTHMWIFLISWVINVLEALNWLLLLMVVVSSSIVLRLCFIKLVNINSPQVFIIYTWV